MWFRPRSIFLLSFAALVTQVRFTSLLFRDFGMDDSKIGLSLGVGLFAGALMVPTWSRLADTRGSLLVLKIILIGHLGATLLYAFTPLVVEENRVWFTMFARVLGMGFIQALSPVADAYALRRLAGSRAMYGKERAWGSFSWGLSAVIVGALMNVMNWMAAYGLFTTILTGATLVILHYSPPDLTAVSDTAYSGKIEDANNDAPLPLHEQTFVIEPDDKELQAMTPEDKERGSIKMDPKVDTMDEDEPDESTKLKDKPKSGITIFLRQADVTTVVFLCVMLCLEMGQSLTESLEFLFIVEELKSSPLLCGVSVAVAVVLEVPLLWLSEPLLRRIGILFLMLFGIFVFCIRITAFTFISSKNPWVILSVEPLGGIYVALLKMSSVSFMSQAAPRGQEAVAMGTMNIFRCMGQVFGTVIGSYVLQHYGPTVLYRSFGVLVTLAGFVLIWIFYQRKRRATILAAAATMLPMVVGDLNRARGASSSGFVSAGIQADKAGVAPTSMALSVAIGNANAAEEESSSRRNSIAVSSSTVAGTDVIKTEIGLLELHKT